MRQLPIALAFFASIACSLGSWGPKQTGRLWTNDLYYVVLNDDNACKQLCEAWGDTCQSIDYNTVSKYCFLNAKRKEDDMFNWAAEAPWVYYERVSG